MLIYYFSFFRRFVMNLLAGNLISCLSLGSLILINPLVQEHPGPLGCAVAEGFTALATMAAPLAVLLIAGDQFMAVTDPLHYHSKVSNVKFLVAVIIHWSIILIFAVTTAVVPSTRPSVWNFCKKQEADSETYDVPRIVNATLFITLIAASLLAICWMYVKISVAAHKSAKPPAPPPPLMSMKIDRSPKEDAKIGEESVGLLMSCDKKSVGSESSEGAPVAEPTALYEPALSRSLRSVLLDVNRPFPTPLCLKLTHEKDRKGLSHDDIYKITQTLPAPGLKTVRSSPNFGSSDCRAPSPPPRCSSSYMTSLRCRISNASLFKYKEESRAARISSLVIFLALGTQLPAALLQVIPSIGLVGVWALFFGATISPFVFAYRSTRIKEELCRLCCRRSSEDMSPLPAPLRRASSLSTERSWRASRNSSHKAWKLLRAFAAESEARGKHVPDLLGCPPGKSILKRVRAQSRIWGRKSQRCKFFQESSLPTDPDTIFRRNSLESVPTKNCLESVVIGSIDNVESGHVAKDIR